MEPDRRSGAQLGYILIAPLLVADGLRILPDFAVFFRAKLLIFFGISAASESHNP
jgi:hypothetical protein